MDMSKMFGKTEDARQLIQPKLHIALLGFRDFYHLVAKNYQTSDVKNAWLTQNEIIPYVKRKNRDGYTCWISLNDKEKGVDSIEGVKALCVFWLDVDSKRPDKTVVATKEQLKEALERAQKLKAVIENEYAAIGFLAYSGNGFHIHFPLPRFELPGASFRREVNKKMRVFAKNIASKANVEIDHTYDIRRVTTLIGSLNLKIPERPLQTRWDKQVFDKGFEDALKLVKKAREQNKGLLETILNIKVAESQSTQTQVKEHPRFKELLEKDGKLRSLYQGEWSGYKSRSEAEEALLVKLVSYGFSDSEIMQIMENCQIGKWQEKANGYREHSLKKAREYIATKKNEEPIILSHLNMIEDPNVAGKPVIVEAVVSSTSIAYLAPAEIEAHITDKDGNEQDRVIEISGKNPVNIKLVGINEDIKFKRLKRFVDEGKVRVEEKTWRTVYKIRVRPPVFTLEKRGEKIVDERGFEYKAYDIYVTADKPITFQPSSLIQVEGIALPNPKTQKTTLLVYKVEFPEEVQLFNVEKIKRFKTKLEGMTVKQRLEWILDNFEKYSQIVGRRNLAEAGLLGFFTPTWIRFNGELQKGWGNILVCGDTTTAKSETLRKLLWLLKAGMFITAETASTVGLTGTATQVEKEGWFVDWGFLVLCDRRLLAVDGAHKLSMSNWCVLAEAERSGIITIAKAAKNSAYARTRQIKIANAVDREADKYTTKSLASFLYPCQALATILDKTSIARLDLAVFADQRDVKPDEINVKFKDYYDKDLELLAEVLKWCWSDLAEIKFTDEAVTTLLTEATNLYNAYFCEMIPVISIDLKWKLARLSAALAYLTISTEDFSIVEVTKLHVEEVVNFLKEEYNKVGLNTLAQQTKFEVLNRADVVLIISRIQNALVKSAGDFGKEKIKQILRYIVVRGRFTKDELKAKFSLSENNEARPLIASLKSEGLIKISRGFYPEPKLIQAYKVTGGFS